MTPTAPARTCSLPEAPWSTIGRMDNVIPIQASALKVACSSCNLRELCLPVGVSNEQMVRLDQTVASRSAVARGEALFRSGEAFSSLFAARAGFFKTCASSEDGRDQVTGFQIAGELLGLDGIGSDRHTCDAVALEDSQVCIIPYHQLEDLSRELPYLQRHFHKIMSCEIVRDHGVIAAAGQHARRRMPSRFYVEPDAASAHPGLLGQLTHPAHGARRDWQLHGAET